MKKSSRNYRVPLKLMRVMKEGVFKGVENV